MIYISDDNPKYKKKSTAKPPTKAKHKHVYEPCLLERPLYWWRKKHEQGNERDIGFSSYCPVCGKIGDIDVKRCFISIRSFDVDFHPYIRDEYTKEAQLELDPKTRTIPVFKVDDPFVKFVDIGEE